MQSLYLIQCQQFYKIGIANDIENRLVQLSTGNPFELEVLATYGFENATAVETVLHQKFNSQRARGEWFELNAHHVDGFHTICQLLGGIPGTKTPKQPTLSYDDIEEAEALAEHIDGAKWDYSAMFCDGWRMEYSGSISAGTKGKVWIWRRGSYNERKALYGGRIDDLPHSIEEMRRLYQKKSVKMDGPQ